MNTAKSLRMLQWLVDHGKDCTDFAMVDAVEEANFEKLLFLKTNSLDHSADIFSLDAFLNIELEFSSLEIYAWLEANYSEDIDFTEVEWDEVPYPEVWEMFFQFGRT